MMRSDVVHFNAVVRIKVVANHLSMGAGGANFASGKEPLAAWKHLSY